VRESLVLLKNANHLLPLKPQQHVQPPHPLQIRAYFSRRANRDRAGAGSQLLTRG
jgi:hypothetical protein